MKYKKWSLEIIMDYQEQEKSNLLMPFLGIKTSKNIKKGAQKELLFLDTSVSHQGIP